MVNLDLQNLTADEADLVRVQGSTLPIQVAVKDQAGAPVDLTGGSVTMYVANYGNIVVMQASGTLTNATTGEAEVVPAMSDLDLPPGGYAVQFEYTDVNGARSVYPIDPMSLYIQGTFVPVPSGSGSGSGS